VYKCYADYKFCCMVEQVSFLFSENSVFFGDETMYHKFVRYFVSPSDQLAKIGVGAK